MRKLQNARAAAFEFHDCLQLQLHVNYNVACCMLQQLPVSFHRHVHMRRRCPFKSALTEDSRSGMHVCLHLSDHEQELTLKLNVATGTQACLLPCVPSYKCTSLQLSTSLVHACTCFSTGRNRACERAVPRFATRAGQVQQDSTTALCCDAKGSFEPIDSAGRGLGLDTLAPRAQHHITRPRPQTHAYAHCQAPAAPRPRTRGRAAARRAPYSIHSLHYCPVRRALPKFGRNAQPPITATSAQRPHTMHMATTSGSRPIRPPAVHVPAAPAAADVPRASWGGRTAAPNSAKPSAFTVQPPLPPPPRRLRHGHCRPRPRAPPSISGTRINIKAFYAANST